MELVNDFTVNSPIEETWHTLTDVERIAPCMPGAQLEEVEGDTFRGVVKVKVGPILAKFKGQATFVERNDADYRAVIKADGRDTAGKGNAAALVTAQLESLGESLTKCSVVTDLTITGKVAQFGRGAMQDISTKLLGQFVENLHTLMAEGHPEPTETPEPAPPAAASEAGEAGEAGEPAPAEPAGGETTPAPAAAAPTAPAAETAAPTVRKIASADVEPIDLLETAGAPLLKRLLPLAGVLLVLVLLLRRRRRA